MSSNQDYKKLQINSEDDATPTCSRGTVIFLVLTSLLVSFLVTFFITKSHYESTTTAPPPISSSVAYEVPTIFEARLQLRLPYMDFAEPIHASVDYVAGSMRISYFSGMDTYIFHSGVNTTSLSIVPVYTTLTCLSSLQTVATPLQALFPMMSLFSKTSVQQRVDTPVIGEVTRSAMCDVWTYTAGHQETGSSNASLPDQNGVGYTGVYTFFVDSVSGAPVAFRAVGHNVVVGGSHLDEYWMDYLSVSAKTELDPALFQAPHGMTCRDSSSPFGPISMVGGDASRSNPTHDLAMMFPDPESARRRIDVFDAWTVRHGKQYVNEEERIQRSAIFHSNLRFINSGNRRGRSYTMSANHMTDRTSEERRAFKGRKNTLAIQNARVGNPVTALRTNSKSLRTSQMSSPPTPTGDPGLACNVYKPSGKPLATNVDWRSKNNGGPLAEPGFVWPPKDQGTCGSCWSFGFTGAIEGAWSRKTGQLIKLSEQNIVDCSWYYGNNACSGGTDYVGFAWLLEQNNGSLASDASYGGYLNQDGFCHYSLKDDLLVNPYNNQVAQQGARITGCTHVTAQWNSSTQIVSDLAAVEALSDALMEVGPISVTIDATLPDFYFYNDGLFYNPDCSSDIMKLDHIGVLPRRVWGRQQLLAVGYETHDNQRYTIIRNSWSTHWGMKGYGLISQKNNNCGVGTAPAFVTV